MNKRDELHNKILKDYGEDAVGILKAGAVVPTGSLGLDAVIGCGGIPLGTMTEIFGPSSGGKTMMSYSIIGNAIRKFKKPCAIIDMETSFNDTWAMTLGVNLELDKSGRNYKWLDKIYPPNGTGDEAVDILEDAVKSGVYSVIVVDSVDALTPVEEMEGKTEDVKKRPGLKAKLLAVAMRKLNPWVKKTNTAVVFINQIRDNIGVMWGDPETTPGGLALKFYCSVRLRVNRVGKQITDPESGEIVGHTVNVKTKKTRFGAPFREAEFNLLYYRGLDRFGEIYNLGKKYGVIKQSGSNFVYDGTNLGNKENLREEMKKDPLLVKELYDATLKEMMAVLHPRQVIYEEDDIIM